MEATFIMEQIPLAATLREGTGKGLARKLRAAGQVPAVIYGSGSPATSLSVSAADLIKLQRQISGDTAFLALSIEDQPPRLALLQELQHDHMGRKALHLDFLELKPEQKVTLEIPLEFKGQPQGVTVGGELKISAHRVHLRGRVDLIPSVLAVDISGLGTGQTMHVADAPLPEGVEMVYAENFTLASVSAPVKIEEAPAEADAKAAKGKGGKGKK